MYTNQLTELLKSFTAKELMRFGKFLNSPYFNNRKMMLKLFTVLKKYHPDFENKNFTKEHLYKLVYKNAEYNDSTFRNLMSDLLKLALQFLKYENIEKRESESSFFLTNEILYRNPQTLFLNQMAYIEHNINRRNKFDADYFISKYRIETERFYHSLLTRKIIKKSFATTESEKLLRGIVYILCYFVIESLKHNDTLLKYSRTYNINKDIEAVSQFLELFNFEKIVLFIRNNLKIDLPVIEIYHKLLKTFINVKDNSAYFDFKKTLIHNSKDLGSVDNNFLFTRLIDYCIFKKNLGIDNTFDTDREIFNLLKIFIENEYYKTEMNTYLTMDLFRNVLINCIAVKELAYMEEFISNYSNKLLPKDITNVENYSFALLNFEKKNYNKALHYLNRVKFDQFVYKLDMKNLQLKINFELGYYESAISVIDTYKHFLKNNQLLSESRKVLHNNFLSYTLKLIHYKTGSEKINLSYLADRVGKSRKVFDKGWLLDKINLVNKSTGKTIVR
jgi:hypothetical protein